MEFYIGLITHQAASMVKQRPMPEHLQSTAQVPLNKATIPQKLLQAHSRETAVKKTKKGKGSPILPELLEKWTQ